jgi:glycosyltransferase involved in cell wall biosynthesis
MLRVAYTTRAPFISGAERSLQIMVEYAPRYGISPLILCPARAAIIPWCRERQVAFKETPLADRDRYHPFRWAHSVARIAWILSSERVDVVHSNQVWAFSAAGTAARLLQIPRVCHMRDEVGTEAMRWWCKPGVESVICISEHIADQVRDAWPLRNRAPTIRTMINPLIDTMLDPVQLLTGNVSPIEESLVKETRASFGIADSTFVFGFIGQIRDVKGLQELLRALASVVGCDWQLLVAGTDPTPGAPYETACREYARTHFGERVRFIGFTDDVSKFYRAIDVAVVPSLEEPLGRIPLEAAAFGRPSIAFATGGLRETILSGKTGWLVPSGDVRALGAALRQAAERSQVMLAMGAQARAHVKRLCDPERYMLDLARMYRALRARRPPPPNSSNGPEPPQATAQS